MPEALCSGLIKDCLAERAELSYSVDRRMHLAWMFNANPVEFYSNYNMPE